MLVIRRRAGQSILIGESVAIEIIEISPSRVKLGITAPQEISVQRQEVKLTREQNMAAATLSPEKLAGLIDKLSTP